MAYEFYISIEATKQGKFKGESIREEHKEKLAGLKFFYDVASPKDMAGGQAVGKRQHQPVRIVKEWGAASPQLFQACVTNEVLKSVTFEFIHTTAEGQEEIYYTVKLTNATIAGIKQYIEDSAKTQETSITMPLEEVSFTFQKIEIEHKPGKTMASDDWKS